MVDETTDVLGTLMRRHLGLCEGVSEELVTRRYEWLRRKIYGLPSNATEEDLQRARERLVLPPEPAGLSAEIFEWLLIVDAARKEQQEFCAKYELFRPTLRTIRIHKGWGQPLAEESDFSN